MGYGMRSRRKTVYRELCAREPSVPLFNRDWWLDAVCGIDGWDAVLAFEERRVAAALPYHAPIRGCIVMPPLTQCMGPWLAEKTGGSAKRLSRQKRLMGQLIEGLPPYERFDQRFHYSVTNWLPFYWSGFRQTTRYTYVVEGIGDLERVRSRFSHAKRKNIKRASRLLSVRYDLGKEEFYAHHEMTLRKQGRRISYGADLFFRLHDAAVARGRGRNIYAVDAAGVIHSALFIVWDDRSAYDLISTIDPDRRSSGSASLLVQEAIGYVSAFVDLFDFEGSMIESVENSFRQFGAVQKPYFHIFRDNRSRLKRGWQRIRASAGR